MMAPSAALLLTMLSFLACTYAFNSIIPSRFSRSMVTHASVVPKPLTSDVSAVLLRSLELFDQNGMKQYLGSLMGDDKSVVVFLRHLG
jgi:hypothetical protein